jgi:hypothetical protein
MPTKRAPPKDLRTRAQKRSDDDRKHGCVPLPPDKRQLLTHEEWTLQYRVYENLKDARMLSKLNSANDLRAYQLELLARERRSLRRQWKALERMAAAAQADLEAIRAAQEASAEQDELVRSMNDKVSAWFSMQASLSSAVSAAMKQLEQDED